MRLGITRFPDVYFVVSNFLRMLSYGMWSLWGLDNGIASWFTNDVRLFGFLYLSSVFMWNYVAVTVFTVVRGLPSALWLVGGSLVY